MSKLRRYKDRGILRLPAVICIAIILVYTSIRLLTLSLSNEIGQAKNNLGSLIMSKLCISVMESGSSLVSYQSDKEDTDSLLMGILEKEYIMYGFTEENRSLAELMKETGKNPVDGGANATETSAQTAVISEEVPEAKQYGSIGFRDITECKLPKEYILTNGAAFDQNSFYELVSGGNDALVTSDGQLPVGVIDGDVYFEETEDNLVNGEGSEMEVMRSDIGNTFTQDQLKDVSFLMRNFYIVDPSTSIVDSLFDSEVLLGKDMTLKQGKEAPQILIYHTHSQEAFLDSREGVTEDTVVGVGDYLTKILREDYGYNVIHDTTTYDIIGGTLDRSEAYNYAEDGVSKILEENPSIEVVIDLHRDALEKRSTMLEGKETAQIMLFNGLSRNKTGPRTDLDNPYLQDNLAFSFQLQLKSLEMYPGLFYRNYLQGWRYNLHLRQKSILVELGTEKNTLESAMNAMEPFAEVLDAVLQGEN